MSTSCIICKRELTNDISVIKGIGPICREKNFQIAANQKEKVCDYDVEFYNKEKVVVIHELADPANPKISLTNCIEYVIKQIIADYSLCPGIWSFVEHASWKADLFGGYEEYDLVSLDGENVEWRYIWHSDSKGEIKPFSKAIIADRVLAYRRGERKVHGRPLPSQVESEVVL